MTFTELENALHTVIVTASGLANTSVCFSHLRGPAPQAEPYARIEVPPGEPRGSVDTVTDASPSVPGAEINVTTAVRHRLPVRVHCFGTGATALATQIADDLLHPTTVDLATGLGLSISDARATRLPVLFETTIQDRAVLDLTAWAWLTRAKTQTFIETVYGEGTYAVPGASPVVQPIGPVAIPVGD